MFKKYEVHKVRLSNGCDMAYIDEGSGDTTLLMVHGLANYCGVWVKNIEVLKQHYRCIAIDLPGNGYSDTGDFTYGINFFSGCVYDFMLQLNLQNVVPIGHSMGGQVLLNLVISHPGVCKKLVLCAPAGFETFTHLERTLYKTSINFLDFFSTEENSLRKIIHASFHHYPRYADNMLQELVELMHRQPVSHYRKMVEACIDGMMAEPVYDKLHTIEQQVLVIYGERDALIPNRLIHHTTTKAMAEQAVAKMQHARLEMLPGCGHFVQLEKPDVVNSLITEFVA
ncbi:MAG TPA: alpha/beta hydrolase [Flavipsychrobacter sp.]